MGGLGIPRVSTCADVAFVASVGSSWSLQKTSIVRVGYSDAVLRLTNKGTEVPLLQINDVASPPNTTTQGFRQNEFMRSTNKRLLENIMVSTTPKTRIILQGRSCKGANYWLTSIPNKWTNSEINPAAFRLLLKYHMGVPLLSMEQNCPDCGKVQDIFGHHALTCKVASGAIDKHNSLVNCISTVLKNAKIAHDMETGNPNNKSKQRPGDIFMHGFDNYGDAYFDVSVINICADAYWKRAAKGQLEGANIRYEHKMKKYPDLGGLFKTLVVEHTGGWHAYSFDYLKKISEHIAARMGVLARDALNSILSGTSMRLQRHQGTMLVRRCLGL